MIEFRLVFKDKALPETMGSYPQIDWVFHGFPLKCVILSHHFLSREVSKSRLILIWLHYPTMWNVSLGWSHSLPTQPSSTVTSACEVRYDSSANGIA